MISLHLVGLVFIIGCLLYTQAPAILWLLAATVLAAVDYYIYQYSVFYISVWYTLFLSIFSLLSIKFIRKRLITKNLLGLFRAKLPKISATESQAIEAGDVWWEGDIFSANINWNNVANNKITELTTAEQNFINVQVERLCELINDWDVVSKEKDLSKETWEYLKNNKFFAISIPKKYGGLGFSASAQSAIVTKIASKSVTAAVTVMVPSALGPGELLVHYGTDEQKNHYLPRLASSQDIPCFALTSIHAGSDAGGMNDRGIVCKQVFNGKEVLGIKLNFNKRYITLAPVSTLMGLAFKLEDPDCLYSNKKDLGVTLALIPTDVPGIDIGHRHYAMFMPFQNGPIVGKDVFIPMDYIIGGPDYIGKGWYMLMECLSGGRGISLPALSTATCQVSYLSSTIYTVLRKQFKTPICYLEGVQEKLAKISGLNFIANAMRVVTVSAIDQGLKPAVVSGISKYHMTEMSRLCINNAMDIHAGKAVIVGPKNALANLYISSPISITVEGANILTRNLIIFGQGAFRAHPYILKELLALQDSNDKKALSQFDSYLFKHIKFVVSNKIKLLVFNVERIIHPLYKKSNWLKAYKKDIDRMSTALAFVTDMSLLFIGGNLKIKERISARLGDIVSNIYMSMCVINQYSSIINKLNNDKDKNADFIKLLDAHTKWSLEYLLYQLGQSLDEVLRNFPVKYVGALTKLLVMPWGQSYKYPKDNLEKTIALSGMNSVDYFNKMTSLCYKGQDSIGEIYSVFTEYSRHKDLINKLDTLVKQKAVHGNNDIRVTAEMAYSSGLIEVEEYNTLINLAGKIDKIINVDDFESLTDKVLNKIDKTQSDFNKTVEDY